MRALADSLRNKWKSAVVVLASAEDGNVSIVSAVTKDLTGKVHAGKLVGAVAQAVGGKGGGRPDMAEGGGKDRRRRSTAALESTSTARSESNAVGHLTNPSTLSSSAPAPPASPAASSCRHRGVKTVLVDKGCVVNSIYHYPTNMTFFTTPELLEIGNIPMTSLNEKPNRTEALKYYRRVADHYHLDIRQYERWIASPAQDNAFQVFTTDRLGCAHTYHARKIVLATGYYDVPNLLNVPGERIWTRSCTTTKSRIRTTTTTWPSSAPRTPPPSPPWNCGGPAPASP